MKKSTITLINFSALTVILSSIVLLFWLFQSDRTAQMWIGVFMSVIYVAWGMVYHAMRGDLHPKIVVEYLLVGSIAVVLISTVVWM